MVIFFRLTSIHPKREMASELIASEPFKVYIERLATHPQQHHASTPTTTHFDSNNSHASTSIIEKRCTVPPCVVVRDPYMATTADEIEIK